MIATLRYGVDFSLASSSLPCPHRAFLPIPRAARLSLDLDQPAAIRPVGAVPGIHPTKGRKDCNKSLSVAAWGGSIAPQFSKAFCAFEPTL